MTKLDKSKNNEITFVSEGKWIVPLFNDGPPWSNGCQLRHRPTDAYIFNEETIQALCELGEALRQMRRKMVSEGYDIVNGKVIKSDVIKY